MSMKSRIIFSFNITILCLLCFSCNKQKDLFVLSGEVYGEGRDSIIVSGFDTRFDKTDTIRYENGTFSYSLTPDTILPLLLSFSDGSQEMVFAEKGVSCHLQKSHPDSICLVYGSTLNDQLSAFRIAAKNDTCVKQTIARIDSFISSDPFSQVSPYLIYDYLLRYDMTDRESISNLLKKMSGTVQDNSFVADLKNTLIAEKNIPLYLPNIIVADSSAKRQPFDKLVSDDNILVIIWASWDEKSRHDRKMLTMVEEKYRNKEFTIADVSIDTNTKRWEMALEEDSLDWPQFIDVNGWNSSFVTNFNIEKLPFYILLSGEKRVLLFGESLKPITEHLDTTLTKKSIRPIIKSKPKIGQKENSSEIIKPIIRK